MSEGDRAGPGSERLRLGGPAEGLGALVGESDAPLIWLGGQEVMRFHIHVPLV